MKIVEFADGRDSSQCHFQKCHARCIVKILRVEADGSAIHHFAPGPETVLVVCCAILRAAADHALEGMRMSVDKTGKHCAIIKPKAERNFMLMGRLRNPAGLIAQQSVIASETSAGVDQIG